MIAAPGVCITSTWNDGKFKSISGTSMASPHVAGLVARCIDAGPCAGMAPAQIIAKLKADAAARPADAGFLGDTHRAVDGKFYGNLVDDIGLLSRSAVEKPLACAGARRLGAFPCRSPGRPRRVPGRRHGRGARP